MALDLGVLPPRFLRCSKCKEEKPEGAFLVRKARPRGRGRLSQCRPCLSVARASFPPGLEAGYQRTYRERQKARDLSAFRARERRFNLKRYGLTPTEYDALVEKQGGRCALCGTLPTNGTGKRGLHVDHDHVTGAVRGLLCHGCNTGLGAFRESPDRLRRALAYLTGVDS